MPLRAPAQKDTRLAIRWRDKPIRRVRARVKEPPEEDGCFRPDVPYALLVSSGTRRSTHPSLRLRLWSHRREGAFRAIANRTVAFARKAQGFSGLDLPRKPGDDKPEKRARQSEHHNVRDGLVRSRA